MIGWLEGVVRLRDPKFGHVIVQCGGVGYELMVSLQTLANVPEEGEHCALWVHTHAREEALELFGFARREEKLMFGLLLSVPQVGPRLAITILGGLPLEVLVPAIASGELAKLRKIPGVGKKTAERVLLDLGERVRKLDFVDTGVEGDSTAAESSVNERLHEEARAALVHLGWRGKQVDSALCHVIENDAVAPASLDELVRLTLSRLMQQ